MNASFIQDCLQNNVDVTITLKASDLTAFGQFLIDNANREAAEKQQMKDEEIYLSPDEVLKVLNIKTRSTLWRWSKRGYLVPVKVGKMLRYKKSDVDQILNA